MSRRAGVVALLALAGGALAVHLLPDGASGPTPPPERSDLRAWEMLGCWEVRLTSWTATPGPVGPERGGGRAGGDARSAPGAHPDALEPPSAVMLLADSVDLWGRVLGSYRAVPMEAGRTGPAAVGEAARAARSLRWFTAGDTLWLIWSEESTRAGVALVPHDGHLRGSARALADSADVSAGAEAWPINCATGERTPPAPWRRR